MMRTAVGIAALVAVAGTASAQLSFFTDFASWQAAVGGASVTTEDFNGVATGDYSNGGFSTSNLTVSHTANGTTSVLNVDPGANFGNLDGTNFIDATTGPTPGGTVTFTFAPGSVFAFGADFFSPFSGAGIDIVVDGQAFALDAITGFNQGFAGVVSTGSFTEVVIQGNYDNGVFQELWSADNVRYAVPTPGAFAVIGLGGLIALRRRR